MRLEVWLAQSPSAERFRKAFRQIDCIDDEQCRIAAWQGVNELMREQHAQELEALGSGHQKPQG